MSFQMPQRNLFFKGSLTVSIRLFDNSQARDKFVSNLKYNYNNQKYFWIFVSIAISESFKVSDWWAWVRTSVVELKFKYKIS